MAEGEPNEDFAARHLQSLLGQRDGEAPALWGPPYHLKLPDFVWIGMRFDRSSVKRVLPKDLTPADEPRGFVAAYNATQGFVLAPFTCMFWAVELKDRNAPDGSPGIYCALSLVSGRAAEIQPRHQSTTIMPGFSSILREGDCLDISGGTDGTTFASFSVDGGGGYEPQGSGIHDYYGIDPFTGSTNKWSISYSGAYRHGRPLTFDIGPDAPEVAQLLRPTELLWAGQSIELTVTIGPPHGIGGPTGDRSAQDAILALIDLFSRLGHSAFMVDRNARILRQNFLADSILGDGLRVLDGRLVVDSPRDQAELLGLIEQAVSSSDRFSLDALALPRREHDTPLFVRALPIRAIDDGLALVLVSDPSAKAERDPVPLLRLLGLTPAEAKLAAQVGGGLVPREAAERLSITEHTARTYLRIVYDKLAIGKQTELARLVARLESLGA